ncbi:acyltransferase [Massilia sp. CF038]|uniref:acyltransferase family protein n=1 Tax=Massilia sp. CF038 TaxID=1881045 RepID=UPI0009192E77|nr:acyltransferase [Massilia sp. CF038]SHH11828.1 Peptidoglycan/LPS O-acetylase OafA/YrhL, contains acyltransferase and SGNH-hydrolase domains [Massilia sp. CF038]
MSHTPQLPVLNGWRGLSILLVLAAHLLPLGPKPWQLNYSAGILGMAVFFTLSGFLITSALLREPRVRAFLVRRFSRVVPLAWLAFVIALLVSDASVQTWLAHYLFYGNLPPRQLVPLTLHMWSLCLEVQFYVLAALLVACLRTRGLWLLPVLGLMFTGLRIWHGVYASDISYYRVDEILAGCTLALLMHADAGASLRACLARIPQWPLLLLLVLSCMPLGTWLNFARPYLAAMLVGATLVAPNTGLVRSLDQRFLLYLAVISYALYVIHPLLAATWLGSGDLIEKYAKRPLLFAAVFALAHISTHYFERWFIERGRLLANRLSKTRTPSVAAAVLPVAPPFSGENDGA